MNKSEAEALRQAIVREARTPAAAGDDNTPAQHRAFRRFAAHVGAYLDANGWFAAVVGGASIQQHPAHHGTLNYELVVRFTGRRRESARPRRRLPRRRRR